jgi:hypothetical protein
MTRVTVATAPLITAAQSVRGYKERQNVSELLADTLYTYQPSRNDTVAPGDIIRTRSEGFSYEVLAAGASGDVETAGGVKLRVLAGPEGLSVRAFGATGLGVVDDAPAIQAAINKWVAGDVAQKLVFPTGIYKCNTQISAIPTASIVAKKTIEGGNSVFLNDSGANLFKFSILGTGRSWQNLNVWNMDVLGGPGGYLFEGGDRDSQEWFWLACLKSLTARSFTANGFILQSGFFESQLYSCIATGLGSNQTGHGFLLQNANNGIVSSIDMYGCTTRYGRNGIRTVTPGAMDTCIYGGTFLFAWESGIHYELCQGGKVTGAHVEDNWQSESGSQRPGIYASGTGGAFTGIYGVSRDAATQNYALQLFAGIGNSMSVVSGHHGGTIPKFGYYDTDPLGSVNSFGVTYDRAGLANIVSFSRDGTVTPAATLGEIFIPYAESVTPNLRRGTFVNIAPLTGNITINNPTTSATFSPGTALEITVVQDATGGRTITWGSAFNVLSAARSGANQRTIWSFRLVDATWQEVV